MNISIFSFDEDTTFTNILITITRQRRITRKVSLNYRALTTTPRPPITMATRDIITNNTPYIIESRLPRFTKNSLNTMERRPF